jgi:hypothetical protein
MSALRAVIGDEVEVTFHRQGDRYVFDYFTNHSATNTFILTGIVLGIDEETLHIRAEGANITIYFASADDVPEEIYDISEGDEVTVTFHEEDEGYIFDELNSWTPQ